MKKILLGITIVVIIGAGYYLVSPLFIDKAVNDALPVAVTNENEAGTDTETSLPDTPVVSGPFPINGTAGHSASGDVRVIKTKENDIVRFENYDGTNGPDLYVYLTNDLENADDFVSLGRSKGNQGNANYEVQNDVTLDEYQYVVTWCQAFGVLFDYAKIN